MQMYDHAWLDFQQASWVGVVDELHALYLKAQQKKNQTPEFKTLDDAHPWVMAMWPQQPNPMGGSLWTPGMRLGWALASPPETRNKKLDTGQRKQVAGVPTLGQSPTRAALEGTIIE